MKAAFDPHMIGHSLLVQYLFAPSFSSDIVILSVAALAVIFAAIVNFPYFSREWEKWKVRRALRRFLSPEAVKKILDNPDVTRVRGQEKELTVLFSSIRGFTSLADELSPTALVDLLNEYFSEMTDVIFKHEGVLDKYIGDAIMAFWGAPYPHEDHAVRACRAALEMQQVMIKLQNHWEQQGRPRLEIGVGINTGTMYVGLIGSKKRCEFTIMGANVNLAARLEGITNQYGTHLMIGETTYEAVRKEMLARELDIVRLKGKVKPVKIFELVGTLAEADQHRNRIDRFGRGLRAYREENWAVALEIFEALVRDYPGDRPSRLYANRCHDSLHLPPQGV